MPNTIRNLIPRWFQVRGSERGATVVEYAILVAMISVAAIAIIVVLGGQIQDAFQEVQSKIQAAQGNP